jgi:hypothetical protein
MIFTYLEEYERASSYGSMYNSALSFSSLSGCSTCTSITDATKLTPATGSSDGENYNYEYFGSMMTDQFCLLLDPNSETCVEAFSFFVFN